LHTSAYARQLNRLHCLLLVACGHSCYEVAGYFGESPRSVELWVHRYAEEGIGGLEERRRGGPGSRKLTAPVVNALEADLLRRPSEIGYEDPAWNGKLLVAHLARRYGVKLSVRHCQRLLHDLKI
ncbi:MAG: helix-turn-helix domain-containing protein, partial [Thermoanaerobaculales bacterium]